MALWNPFGKKKKEPAPESPEPPEAPRQEEQASSPPPSEGESETSAGEVPEEDAPRGFFGRFKTALKKTVAVLNTDIRDLVGKEGRLVDDEFLDELYERLIKTDMGNGPASRIRDGIKSSFRGRKVMMEDLINSVKETVREIMKQEDAEIRYSGSPPTVIMVVGVNGSGKTTSIAKLAHRFTSEGKKVVLGAGDTFRAAAVEQLSIWAERLGAEIIKGRDKSDPASVAYKAAEAARDSGADICIIDTAGRLQTQSNLMEELGRIRRVISKVIPDAPHEVLLVLDATAGQNAISQARGFSEAAGCTGIVLAKLDGTAKGGVAIPIREEFDLPVKFIGLGETPDALAAFDVETYVNAMFSVEDVAS
ncbi:MAG: signal recognition particle-docking protein FtsY [Planctomycetota bacterium]